MHLHENHCIKRAGVAGIRARASSLRATRQEIIISLKNHKTLPLKDTDIKKLNVLVTSHNHA
ncbi:hypothetical protein CA284_03360 [Enterobacter mori]|nr:hypothetical protein CA284_03360 [Enterobacter mori]